MILIIENLLRRPAGAVDPPNTDRTQDLFCPALNGTVKEKSITVNIIDWMACRRPVRNASCIRKEGGLPESHRVRCAHAFSVAMPTEKDYMLRVARRRNTIPITT
jgi:hypothetical protein